MKPWQDKFSQRITSSENYEVLQHNHIGPPPTQKQVPDEMRLLAINLYLQGSSRHSLLPSFHTHITPMPSYEITSRVPLLQTPTLRTQSADSI